MKKQHGNTGNQFASKERTKSAMISFRCYPEIKSKWVSEANKMGLKLDVWIVNKIQGKI